jgi:ferrochelatase
MSGNEKIGFLLVNTGSPALPKTREVRAYLRQFLSDPRVIDIPAWKRWLLLNLVILPLRPRQSAHAYRQVWTDSGSPLIVNSQSFCDALAPLLPESEIEIAMAYGNPSVASSMESLIEKGVRRIVAVPMFPQYASATFGSVLEAVYATAGKMKNVPPISVLPPFYNDAGFLDAWAEVVRPQLETFKPDHTLFSFHGLPERQIRDCDPTGSHCLASGDCCARYTEANPNCYRAHCFETAAGIVERLGLAEEEYTIVFQSKLGRDPWLTPAADQMLVTKAEAGVKRLAVVSPAFVADCLETLEELGLRGKESFQENGGGDFLLVPSLNDHPSWAQAFAALVRPL